MPEPVIPGLSILPSFVSSTEERSLLTFLDSQDWRTDLSRRTIHYGGAYCLMPPRTASASDRPRVERTILQADPIPPQLHFVIDRTIQQPYGLYTPLTKPAFCIVNEYTGTQGISAHVENFRFGEPVCALTLGDGDFMRIHELVEEDDGSVRSGKAAEAKRTDKKVEVWLPARSLMVMRGPARRLWQHEIVRRKKGRREAFRRVSLTLRREKFGPK